MILPVVAYGILIQENIFLFPVSYVTNGETIFISATQGILISIGYPLLAIVGLFIAQMLLFSLVKDTMVSTIVLFYLWIFEYWRVFVRGYFYRFSVLPALQQGVPLVIGACVGVVFSILFIGIRLKNIRK